MIVYYDPSVTESDDDVGQLYALRMRAVGIRIRAARRARDLSQEALADASGVNRSHLAKLEKQGANLQLWTLYAIADALGVHPADLLDDRERQRGPQAPG
jgi:transcriptional regulator with XRE-family HTH domain